MERKFELFTLDTRSLSIFRILLGLVLSLDTIQKAFWAKDFISDWGILPRSVWILDYMSDWKLSFHLASGETWFQVALLTIQLFAALSFMVGWRTKYANFIALIFVCSLQSRNNMILSSGDDLLRMLLFWTLFLPMSSHYAIDKEVFPRSRFSSLGSVAFILQLVLMYLTTAIFKKHPVWLEEGSAIYYALNIDMFVKPLGVLLRESLGLMKFLTWMTLALELIGPFLIFLTGPIRLVAVATFVFFHFSLFLVFGIGTFPWLAMIYWIALLPSDFWDHSLAKRFDLVLEKWVDRLGELFTRLQLVTRAQKEFRIPRLAQVFLSVCLALVVFINFAGVTRFEIPRVIDASTYYLYLNQRWDMFAPYPMRNDGWFVIEGEFKDGRQFDLMTGAPATFVKPQRPSEAYANALWRKWYLNVWDRGDSRILLPFARYLCRKHAKAETGLPSLSQLTIHFMKETTPPPGEPFPPIERVQLWQHDCFK